MFKRHWIFAVVLGAIALASLGQAQESEEQTHRGTNEEEAAANNFPVPLPVVVIEPEETAVASQRAKEETTQREKEDLIAQQGMDSATRRMANFALWQTILIAIGTVALIYTLWLTRKAAGSAQAAVDVTREIGQKQAMAYVHVVQAFIPKRATKDAPTLASISGKERARVEIQLENIGATIAKNVKVRFEVFDETLKDAKFREIDYSNEEPLSNIAPKQKPVSSIISDLPKVIKETEASQTSEAGLSLRILRGEVVYDDVFDNTFRSAFMCMIFFSKNIINGLEEDSPCPLFGTDCPAFEQIQAAKDQDRNH